jgi:hypothetical protein
MGESQKALDWLEKAIHEHSGDMIAIGVAPEFDSLRSDPRGRAILQTISISH